MSSAIINTETKVQFSEMNFRVKKSSQPADLLTPVGLYLKIRDRFPGSILLESADNQNGRNARSFIAFDKLGSITATDSGVIVTQGRRETNVNDIDPFEALEQFVSSIACDSTEGTNVYGYIGYNAIPFIEPGVSVGETDFPYYSFSLYRFVVEFDHLRQMLNITQLETDNDGNCELPNDLLTTVLGAIYPFTTRGEENAYSTNEEFLSSVVAAKSSCARGDIFQVVLSRRFSQQFTGDDFNVYRALRMINPSPYLFYADFENFALFGSSPEALVISKNGEAEIHPIAGTYRKTGDETADRKAEEALLQDAKENAEHVMLVDLARNDLSRFCTNVEVRQFKEVQHYSHVIHLVSKVSGKVNAKSAIEQIKCALPAGTLSGAPKVKAMQIIDQSEKVPRDWYGGCIGTISTTGDVNMAILIRSFLRKNNTLTYQAGAGIVIDSQPEKELEEINHKLGALRSAMKMAENIKS